MDFNDLYAACDSIVEDAHNLEISLKNFIAAQEGVLRWLQERNLHPTGYAVQLLHPDSALRIVITFNNDALVPFAAVEGAFWTFVRDLMPLDIQHTGTADDLMPFRSAEFRHSDWDVVVIPDLDSGVDRFPDVEFWEQQARNERLREEQRADWIRQDRISEVATRLTKMCAAV